MLGSGQGIVRAHVRVVRALPANPRQIIVEANVAVALQLGFDAVDGASHAVRIDVRAVAAKSEIFIFPGVDRNSFGQHSGQLRDACAGDLGVVDRSHQGLECDALLPVEFVLDVAAGGSRDHHDLALAPEGMLLECVGASFLVVLLAYDRELAGVLATDGFDRGSGEGALNDRAELLQ